METTLNNFIIWEEKNLTKPEKKSENNGISVQNDIINDTKKNVIKNLWNDTGKISGIYKIVNKINGKYYIGSSNNIIYRIKHRHINSLKKNTHSNKYLQSAWNKYGEINFEFVIVQKVKLNKLLEEEQRYLDIAKLENNSYNLSFDATSPMLGKKHSEFSKQKMRGRIPPNKGKKGLQIAWNKGKKSSAESKLKMSLSRIGKYVGKNSPLFGKKITDSHKRKISLSNMGKLVGEKNPNYVKTNYIFKNKITSSIFKGTQYDFYTKYSLNQSKISQLVLGKRKSYKNWELENE